MYLSMLALFSPWVIFWILGVLFIVVGSAMLYLFLDEVCRDGTPPSRRYGSRAVYIYLGITGALLTMGFFFLKLNDLLLFFT